MKTIVIPTTEVSERTIKVIARCVDREVLRLEEERLLLEPYGDAYDDHIESIIDHQEAQVLLAGWLR